jgi:hypothetical protein
MQGGTIRLRLTILTALLFVFSAPLFAQASTVITNETVDLDFLVTSCRVSPPPSWARLT